MVQLKLIRHSGAVREREITCLAFLQVREEVQHGGAGGVMAAVRARFKPEPPTTVRNLFKALKL